MSFGTDGGAAPSRPSSTPSTTPWRTASCSSSAAADEPIEEQGDPANILQPTGTGPDINAGSGLSVTAADFLDRRASFAGRGSQISLAAYGTYDGNDNDGPPGIFGAFPPRLNALDTGALGQHAGRAGAARSSTATRATPTCRGRRWRRRWSPRRPRSSATSTRTCRRPRSSACSSRRRAARPAPAGRPTSAGGSSTRAPRWRWPRTIDRRAAVLEDPPHGRGARTTRG